MCPDVGDVLHHGLDFIYTSLAKLIFDRRRHARGTYLILLRCLGLPLLVSPISQLRFWWKHVLVVLYVQLHGLLLQL